MVALCVIAIAAALVGLAIVGFALLASGGFLVAAPACGALAAVSGGAAAILALRRDGHASA